MVVELHHAVVAQVAVAAARWSEDVARLAELEFEKQGLVRQVDLQVVYTCFMAHSHVLFRQEALNAIPASRRDNARLSRSRMDHEEVCEKKKNPERDDCHIPCSRSVPVELQNIKIRITLINVLTNG